MIGIPSIPKYSSPCDQPKRKINIYIPRLVSNFFVTWKHDLIATWANFQPSSKPQDVLVLEIYSLKLRKNNCAVIKTKVFSERGLSLKAPTFEGFGSLGYFMMHLQSIHAFCWKKKAGPGVWANLSSLHLLSDGLTTWWTSLRNRNKLCNVRPRSIAKLVYNSNNYGLLYL